MKECSRGWESTGNFQPSTWSRKKTRPNAKSRHHPCDSPLGVASLPHQTGENHRRHGHGKVSGDELQVIPDRHRKTHQRRGQDAQQLPSARSPSGRSPPDGLPRWRARKRSTKSLHHQRGAGVVAGAHGGHQNRNQACQHQAAQAHRQKTLHQSGISAVITRQAPGREPGRSSPEEPE